MQLKILSWNIWCDCDFAKVSEFLRCVNADIIGLQEIIESNSRDVIGLMKELGYEYVYSTSNSWKERNITFGNAIFSRLPFVSKNVYVLDEAENRRTVEAVLQVGEKRLTVFNVHLKHVHQRESLIQNEQAEKLIRLFPKQNSVVMGDFNATPEMTPIKRMSEVLVDTDPASQPTWSLDPKGCLGCTFTGLNIRLDYMFASHDLKTHSFKVEKDAQGSDHLPVSVLVEI